MSETAESVRILHVDDDPDFLDITAEFLQRENEQFTVDVATSAADGLDRLTENAYDCIVSDYEMPLCDGIKFLKAVRKDHPDLPFVLFTGKGSETIASEAISAGVSEYLQKGSGTDQYTVLANRIENLVSRREAEITVARYDQRERESERYRRELLDITADPDTTTDEKAHQLLELGRERLGAENGHLVKIDEDRNRHEVISVTGSEIVQKGVTDLSKTYCRRTIDSDSIFDVHDAPGAGWEDDPAYQQFELGCYIGRKLLVEGELFGTLCYVSSDPREEPFTNDEKTFFELLARWFTQLLERKRYRSQAETVFEHAQDGIFLVDVSPEQRFRIRRVNRAYEALTGHSTADIEGKSPTDIYGADIGTEIETQYRECVDREGPIEYEVALPVGPHDEPRQFHTKLAPVVEAGTVVELVGATRDVTQRKERQSKLEAERAFIEETLNSLEDVLYLINPDGSLRRWNDRLGAVTGYDDEEIETMAATDFFPPEEREGIADAIDEALGTGRAVVEADVLTTEGERITYEFTGTRLTDQRGDVLGVVGIGRDIAGHKERERELRQYQQILDAMLDPATVMDENGEYTVVNNAMAAVHEMQAEELIGEPSPFIRELREARSDDPYRELVDGEREEYRGEYTMEIPDADPIYFEYRLSRLTIDGRFCGIVAVGRDVTDRTRREDTLEALHERTRPFITTPDQDAVAEHAVETVASVLGQEINTVWLYDEDSETLEPAAWTDAAAELLGEMPSYTGEGSLTWDAFRSGEVLVIDEMSTVNGRHNPQTPIRSEIILPLGEYGVMNIGSTESDAFKNIDVSLARVFGDMVEAALIRTDREEELRDRRRELERQNERLEEFASIVSHDLRNPLNVAEARVQLALDERDSEHLDVAAKAIDRMVVLIDDILQLAREGERIDEMERIDLETLCADCWDAVETAEATLSVESNRPIRADRSRVRQLLENLFRNAVEHGGEDVQITVGALEEGFFVADDGPGIPPDERETVFESGYTTREDGTGFGLAIVAEIADAHDWDVAVTDSEDGGARFEITGVEAP